MIKICRFGSVPCTPLANALLAIWVVSGAPGKLYTGLSTEKKVWTAYLVGSHAEKDLLQSRRIYHLSMEKF